MATKPLSAITVRNLKAKATPYKEPDGKGLFLEVRPSGLKVWRYRFRLDGKEQTLTIGEYGDKADQFTLEAAREARAEARRLVKQGIHPGQQRATIKAATIAEGKNTFRAVALAWLEDNKPHWKPRYYGQVERGVTKVVLPLLGDRPIRSITSRDVLEVIKSKKQMPQAALLLQKWIGAVFRYAIAHQLAETDPTYAVRGSVKTKATKHHAPLALSEIPAFRAALGEATGNRPNRIAVELLMLTFVRPGEMAGAKWAEFDLDGAMWKIPAERMKMGEPHYVPLSAQAVSLLRELHTLTGKAVHLFPNARFPNKSVGHGTIGRVIERIGYGGKFSPHGFRATASTALNEMGFRHDVIEKQLAHAERNKSRASYNQAAYLEERRQMMAHWGNVVSAAKGAKVLPFKATA